MKLFKLFYALGAILMLAMIIMALIVGNASEILFLLLGLCAAAYVAIYYLLKCI